MPLAQCRKFLAENARRGRVLARQLHGRGGPDRRRGAGARHRRHRSPARGRALRARGPGRGHRGPPRQPDPFRGRGAGRASRARPGHDQTSIVCFQRADRPGSLHAILSEFAARNINLTKLESRPTKRGLGDYCFLIDLEGHLADEVVADCLRDLHAELAGVKFLGSYPAAGEHGAAVRVQASAAWQRGRRVDPRLRSPDRRDLGAAAGRAGTSLRRLRRDGRADECEALEKPWGASPGGSNPPPSARPYPTGWRADLRSARRSRSSEYHTHLPRRSPWTRPASLRILR